MRTRPRLLSLNKYMAKKNHQIQNAIHWYNIFITGKNCAKIPMIPLKNITLFYHTEQLDSSSQHVTHVSHLSF